MKNIAITKYPVAAAESMTLVSKINDPGAAFTALQIFQLPYSFHSQPILKKQKTIPGQHRYPTITFSTFAPCQNLLSA